MVEVPVIPAPLCAERREGAPFSLRSGVRVVVGKEPAAVAAAVLAATRIGKDLGGLVSVTQNDDGSPGAIVLRLTTDPADVRVPPTLAPALAVEAYRMEVDARRVVVTALDAQGLVRALATLEQLSHPAGEQGFLVAAVEIVDYPRFAWRGLCLDLARHFFDVSTIRAVIVAMAMVKMNMLHLHLTDDQGWRLYIPSRPALTRLSGTTAVGGDEGGFLSLEDYADVVNYAAAHGITVVPEIDIPGHVTAAQHAYGELNPGGTPVPAYTGVAVGFSRLHGELGATRPFIASVLEDVAAATPGPYVHIGGDEVLTMPQHEYAQLVALAVSTVQAAGKTPVGWQEIGSVPLPPGTVVQYWDERDRAGQVVAAVMAGARVLLSQASRLYLDMCYDDVTPIGQDWAGRIGLRECYEWEPEEVLPVPVDQIAGVEAAIWTETVRTGSELFLLLLPRLAAVAEVAWTAPERRDWDMFTRRLRRLTPRWDAEGLPWFRAAVDNTY